MLKSYEKKIDFLQKDLGNMTKSMIHNQNCSFKMNSNMQS